MGDDSVRVRAAVDGLRERLGTDRFDTRWAEGRAMGDDGAPAFARRELSVAPGES